jgi:hypothetical protein
MPTTATSVQPIALHKTAAPQYSRLLIGRVIRLAIQPWTRVVDQWLRQTRDEAIVLTPMLAGRLKGFAEPVVPYAVKGTIKSRPDEVERSVLEGS